MPDQLGTLEKAREELRKQFFSYAQSLSKGFNAPKHMRTLMESSKLGPRSRRWTKRSQLINAKTESE
jgi:hypothetical protein